VVAAISEAEAVINSFFFDCHSFLRVNDTLDKRRLFPAVMITSL
jgi:hypothetical protein